MDESSVDCALLRGRYFFAGVTDTVLDKFEQHLQNHFTVSSTSELEKYVGFEIKMIESSLRLSAESMIKNIAKKWGLNKYQTF